jgi:uncharacterized membrane protein YfcA
MPIGYWLEFWWVVPIALAICVIVCLVGVEGSIMFAPFYAVVFPWLTGVHLTPLQAIQIGILTEIFGFTSSIIGFARAGLIDVRMGLRTAAVGAPMAVIGVVFAYLIPQPVLMLIVALVLPLLAWYLRRPVQSRPGQRSESVKQAAKRIPLCCYASYALYRNGGSAAQADPHVQPKPVGQRNADSTDVGAAWHEHRDRKGRGYYYWRPWPLEQVLVGAVGGTLTGVTGFGVGVVGVSHLVLRRIPVRVAVGTSHFVILVVTGAAVATHLVEISTRHLTPPWNIIAANVVAVLFGGQLAAWLAGRLPERRIRRVLVTLLLVLALATLVRAIQLLS